MAKKNTTDATPSTPAPAAEKPREKHVGVSAQYVKDLSFESPRAPQSLTGTQGQPQIQVVVDVRATKVNAEQNIFEVTLAIAATAKTGEDALFVMELAYAGLFTLAGIEAGAEMEQTLLIFCPSILFPFARRILAETTRDGGFPPLMLDPIDFAQLYLKRQQAAA